jgi:hypothetical protein
MPDLSRPLPSPADVAPSHTMWVELTTRIATQGLHYRSGEEETAARSVYGLFWKARELMAANPSAAAFNALSSELLNQCIRPYTARWHGWLTSGENGGDEKKLWFKSEIYRRKFRQELKELQRELAYFEASFRNLVTGASETPTQIKPSRGPTANLGQSIQAGIGEQVSFQNFQNGLSADAINKKEAEFVLGRRRRLFNKDQVSQNVIDAIGLAFSGGGIRSATVCLGVAQVLARKKLLAQVDYLSTVSGGGYLGTFLTSFFKDFSDFTSRTPDQKLSDHLAPADDEEPAAVRHIRNNSKYLLHGSVWGKINMAALLLSGLATNVLLVLPLPLIAALVLCFLNWLGFWGDKIPGAAFKLSLAGRTPSAIALVALSGLLALSWLGLTIARRSALQAPEGSVLAKIRGVFSGGTVILLIVSGLFGILFLVPSLFDLYDFLANPSKPGWHLSDNRITAILGLLPFLSGMAMSILKTGRLQKFFSWLLVLSGPLFYLWGILFVGAKLGMTGDPPWNSLLVTAATALLLLWSIFCVDINSGGPHGYYRDRLCECYLARGGKSELTWWQAAAQNLWSNRRPSEQNPAPAAGAEPDKKTGPIGNRLHLALKNLKEPGLTPYHLVNAIVNLPASANQELRGRNGDFFLISPRVCGSPICGYFATETLTAKDQHLDLGTAMAISGAAAAPNMGFHTLPQFRFLMALFNVRLGYWIPNLGKPRPVSGRGVGLNYLLREMAGHMNENLDFLNLSDGGHIENLGVYELMRRKCKFIICVHGGASLGTERGDLQRLQRYVKIDLGIDLEYDLSDLQPDAARQVRAYATLVKIKYSKDEIGWMIYLKPAITGGEPPYVLDFRCAVPDFPNEGLLDQAYSEEKFEAYRALGECLAESLLREEIVGPDQPANIREWFQKLADNLLPDDDDAFLRAGCC